jgi:hypothetical protein
LLPPVGGDHLVVSNSTKVPGNVSKMLVVLEFVFIFKKDPQISILHRKDVKTLQVFLPYMAH